MKQGRERHATLKAVAWTETKFRSKCKPNETIDEFLVIWRRKTKPATEIEERKTNNYRDKDSINYKDKAKKNKTKQEITRWSQYPPSSIGCLWCSELLCLWERGNLRAEFIVQ